MKRSTILFLMLFTTVQFSLTQQDNEIKNSLRDGSWSLQFQITNNFNLGAFQGLMFSGKRHISDNSTIRLGIGMNYLQAENDYITKNIPVDTTIYQSNRSDDGINIDFSVLYVSYLNLKSKVNFYLGAGPVVSIFKNKSASETIYKSNGTTINRDWKRNEWSIGGLAVIGTEWFVDEKISLLAEYGVLFYKRFVNEESIEKYSYSTPNLKWTNEMTTFSIHPSTVKLGVSLYF